MIDSSESIVSNRLHSFGKHPISLQYTYLGVDLNDLSLDNLQLLEQYTNLITINISNNNIKSLESLSNISLLHHLDARYVLYE